MSTLVTGGSGFIGAYVVRELLRRDERVINADLRPPSGEQAWLIGERAQDVEFVSCDITDLASVVEVVHRVRPTRVIHVAGLILGEPRTLMRVNLDGTLNVLEGCRLFDVEKFVTLSSVGVLAPAEYEPLDVRHPLYTSSEPPFNAFYSASKIGAEAACWAYQTTYGLDFTVIRPVTIYGFGEGRGLRVLIEDALAGRSTRIPTGRAVARSWTHASDVAKAIVLAAFHKTPPGGDRIFFGGTDGPCVTLGEIGQIVMELIPGADIEYGDRLSDREQHEMRFRRRVNIDNAREQLGYEPQFSNVRDGLAETAQNYLAYLAERDGS